MRGEERRDREGVREEEREGERGREGRGRSEGKQIAKT